MNKIDLQSQQSEKDSESASPSSSIRKRKVSHVSVTQKYDQFDKQQQKQMREYNDSIRLNRTERKTLALDFKSHLQTEIRKKVIQANPEQYKQQQEEKQLKEFEESVTNEKISKKEMGNIFSFMKKSEDGKQNFFMDNSNGSQNNLQTDNTGKNSEKKSSRLLIMEQQQKQKQEEQQQQQESSSFFGIHSNFMNEKSEQEIFKEQYLQVVDDYKEISWEQQKKQQIDAQITDILNDINLTDKQKQVRINLLTSSEKNYERINQIMANMKKKGNRKVPSNPEQRFENILETFKKNKVETYIETKQLIQKLGQEQLNSQTQQQELQNQVQSEIQKKLDQIDKQKVTFGKQLLQKISRPNMYGQSLPNIQKNHNELYHQLQKINYKLVDIRKKNFHKMNDKITDFVEQFKDILFNGRHQFRQNDKEQMCIDLVQNQIIRGMGKNQIIALQATENKKNKLSSIIANGEDQNNEDEEEEEQEDLVDPQKKYLQQDMVQPKSNLKLALQKDQYQLQKFKSKANDMYKMLSKTLKNVVNKSNEQVNQKYGLVKNSKTKQNEMKQINIQINSPDSIDETPINGGKQQQQFLQYTNNTDEDENNSLFQSQGNGVQNSLLGSSSSQEGQKKRGLNTILFGQAIQEKQEEEEEREEEEEDEDQLNETFIIKDKEDVKEDDLYNLIQSHIDSSINALGNLVKMEQKNAPSSNSKFKNYRKFKKVIYLENEKETQEKQQIQRSVDRINSFFPKILNKLDETYQTQGGTQKLRPKNKTTFNSRDQSRDFDCSFSPQQFRNDQQNTLSPILHQKFERGTRSRYTSMGGEMKLYDPTKNDEIEEDHKKMAKKKKVRINSDQQKKEGEKEKEEEEKPTLVENLMDTQKEIIDLLGIQKNNMNRLKIQENVRKIDQRKLGTNILKIEEAQKQINQRRQSARMFVRQKNKTEILANLNQSSNNNPSRMALNQNIMKKQEKQQFSKLLKSHQQLFSQLVGNLKDQKQKNQDERKLIMQQINCLQSSQNKAFGKLTTKHSKQKKSNIEQESIDHEISKNFRSAKQHIIHSAV